MGDTSRCLTLSFSLTLLGTGLIRTGRQSPARPKQAGGSDWHVLHLHAGSHEANL
jgi:hypothetical protein